MLNTSSGFRKKSEKLLIAEERKYGQGENYIPRPLCRGGIKTTLTEKNEKSGLRLGIKIYL